MSKVEYLTASNGDDIMIRIVREGGTLSRHQLKPYVQVQQIVMNIRFKRLYIKYYIHCDIYDIASWCKTSNVNHIFNINWLIFALGATGHKHRKRQSRILYGVEPC